MIMIVVDSMRCLDALQSLDPKPSIFGADDYAETVINKMPKTGF